MKIRKRLKNFVALIAIIFLIHIVHALTLDRIIQYVEIPFYSSRVSEDLDGYRIAFVADTHDISAERLERVVARLNETDIDMLLVGGDIRSDITDSRWYAIEILSRTETTDGIFASPGNHDLPRSRYFSELRTHGVTDIFNNGIHIHENFYIVGVTAPWHIADAVSAAHPDDFVLLAVHIPDVTMETSTNGIDLILSGHTHGGQVNFFGLWAPYFYFTDGITMHGQRFREGWAKSADGVPVYVTNGIGTYFPRVFARPQVVIITLRRDVQRGISNP
ncbi:MAG: metallophosphoesterase [Clostridiales bacterium]|jgi:predicted MPP superfamily phosphohydrolase|nr:metallophosphoesterase [Clostridiales bacterium]